MPTGGLVVELLGGRYEREQVLELTAEDSGTAEAPIVYRSRPGEAVYISGGKVITGWKAVTDAAVLNRLDAAARGKVFQVDLKTHGITDCGDLGGAFGKPSQLRLEVFFNDQPMQIARWPNDGFMKIAEVLGQTPREVRGTKGCAEGSFKCEGDRLKRWVDEKDVWVLGYWFWDWAEQRHKVKSIDPAKGIIEVEKPYHGYGYRKGQWSYGYNILAEIDQPGEWCIDREARLLYFWPPGDIHKGKVAVTVTGGLLTLTDTSHVTLRGLHFEGTRGTAVVVKGGEGCRVVECTFRNLGMDAITASGGKNHGVVGCDMYGMGCGGISLNGGDRKTLTPAGHFAENNHIHHYSRWDRMYCPAIVLNGVGNRAAHNLIHDAPHMAMGFGGNDHIVEFNEIHSVCYESNDCGAIYAGRNWTMRGHMLRHNYLHHIYGHEGRGCVGNVVSRNIFWLGDGENVRRASRGADPQNTWWDSIAARVKPLVKFENNLVNEEPHFVSPPPKSFTLRDNSPAFKLGFKQIPTEKIGLYQDDRRASWPVTHQVRRMPEVLAR